MSVVYSEYDTSGCRSRGNSRDWTRRARSSKKERCRIVSLLILPMRNSIDVFIFIYYQFIYGARPISAAKASLAGTVIG